MKLVVVIALLTLVGCKKSEQAAEQTQPQEQTQVQTQTQTPAPAVKETKTADLGMCPVMDGNKAKKEFSVDYKGKTYYFCCASCIASFKKAPEKYIAKIK